jgi:hypothetical protein
MIMNPEAQRAKEEGADFIASDTMPTTEPSVSEMKAQKLAKEFAIESLDEYRAQVEKNPDIKARLEESFDQALADIMLDDDLSANDHAEGEAFFKAAQAEKADYVKFLMNDMINNHIGVEEEITLQGKEFMSRLDNRPN